MDKPKLTMEYFYELAFAVRAIEDVDTRRTVASTMVTALQYTNDRFDEGWFLAACALVPYEIYTENTYHNLYEGLGLRIVEPVTTGQVINVRREYDGKMCREKVGKILWSKEVPEVGIVSLARIG